METIDLLKLLRDLECKIKNQKVFFNNIKGCGSYTFPIFVILLFYGLNSSYFLTSYSLWKFQITEINNWV